MKAILMIYSDDDILEVSQVAALHPEDHVTEFVTTLAPFGRNITAFTAHNKDFEVVTSAYLSQRCTRI